MMTNEHLSADENVETDSVGGIVTVDDVKRASEQIGQIYTSFPESKHPDFEEFDDFPISYSTISTKERLLLMFAENFRRQYCVLYPKRKPPVLAVCNECGVQVNIAVEFAYLSVAFLISF